FLASPLVESLAPCVLASYASLSPNSFATAPHSWGTPPRSLLLSHPRVSPSILAPWVMRRIIYLHFNSPTFSLGCNYADPCQPDHLRFQGCNENTPSAILNRMEQRYDCTTIKHDQPQS
ncbi:hypothetical protein ASPZODRAFT_127682, partial [Penicilliopsis zonata CBS 506.65]